MTEHYRCPRCTKSVAGRVLRDVVTARLVHHKRYGGYRNRARERCPGTGTLVLVLVDQPGRFGHLPRR